jgi:hypothetical protein
VQRGSVAEVCYVAVCYRVTLPEELGFETLSSFAIVSTYYSCISPPTSKNPSVSSIVFFLSTQAGRSRTRGVGDVFSETTYTQNVSLSCIPSRHRPPTRPRVDGHSVYQLPKACCDL